MIKNLSIQLLIHMSHSTYTCYSGAIIKMVFRVFSANKCQHFQWLTVRKHLVTVITAGKQFTTVITVEKQFATVITVGKMFGIVLTVGKQFVTVFCKRKIFFKK